MRVSFLLLLIPSIMIISCRKDTDSSRSIYKQWQWENSVGGFTGFDTIKPVNSNTVTLTLLKDKSYITKVNGQKTAQGSYTISMLNGQQILRLENFEPISGLWLGNNGVIVTTEDNRLHLREYNVSEPYTHNFK